MGKNGKKISEPEENKRQSNTEDLHWGKTSEYLKALFTERNAN